MSTNNFGKRQSHITPKASELISLAMEKTGMTRVDLAAKMGVSKAAISVFLGDTLPLYRAVEIYEIFHENIPFDSFLSAMSEDYKDYLRDFFIERMSKTKAIETAKTETKDQLSF